MGALAEMEKVAATVGAVVGELEPERLAGGDAAALVEVFATVKKLCGAGEALAARQVAETMEWRRAGERSAAHWLARRTGSTIGAAAASIDTAQRLDDLPATDQAFRTGRLSQIQAQHIASAAAGRPQAEAELLDVARRDSVQGLRDACQRTAAAGQPDQTQRQAAIHRGRYLKTWTDPDGAGRLDARLTAADLATVLSGLDTFEPDIFTAARVSGTKEPYHAYAADALVAMAAAAHHPNSAGRSGPATTASIIIDHAAMVRGYTVAGETCEIAGVGPVPVAVAKSMMADATLAAIITDGVDVYTVAHLGRSVTAHQRSALEIRDRRCVVPGCTVTRHLEIDHVDGWANTHTTKLDTLARLCHFHHHQKTYDGYQLQGQPGYWQWIPPGHPPDP